ncbi:MAG TPA: AMP-binding protein [Verrucomicrobiae bacterium]
MPGDFPNRDVIACEQLAAVNRLLEVIHAGNAFYQEKFMAADAPHRVASLAEFSARFPFTTKTELVADHAEHPPFGTNLSFPLERYTRTHQTSGTTGNPLRWLDTPESWAWMVTNWAEVFHAAGITNKDRIFFAFSFGPFIGFWLAFEAGEHIGAMCIPGGGLSTAARLRSMIAHQATALCCTPTYALHLAEVAAQEKIDLTQIPLRTIVVAGEPGGSIPATRERLSHLWNNARIFDHHGMTEVGPVTYECPAQAGVLHIIEPAFYPEVIDTQTGALAARGELVLTTLGRTGSPLLRYRTGDLVKVQTRGANEPCVCGRHVLALEGGILGRVDDMIVVRGVNVYPTAIESIVRQFPEVAEYRVRVTKVQSLTELKLEVELVADCADTKAFVQRLQKAFQESLALRVPIEIVAANALPRYELKAKRWVVE